MLREGVVAITFGIARVKFLNVDRHATLGPVIRVSKSLEMLGSAKYTILQSFANTAFSYHEMSKHDHCRIHSTCKRVRQRFNARWRVLATHHEESAGVSANVVRLTAIHVKTCLIVV